MNAAEEVMDTELDFGQGRRLELQLALRFVLKGLENQPFTGSRLLEGQIAPEFEDADTAGAYYQKALLDFLTGLGCEVMVVPTSFGVKPDDVVLHEFDDGAPGQNTTMYLAPFETVVIAGKVPGNALNGGRKASAQIIEAGAEILRVMLGTAVVAAFDECEENESVVVYLRSPIELAGRIDFESGFMTGLVRLRGIVYCKNEPRVSYLLGSAWGQTKPLQLAWEFPLVEHIYGQNRLRWNDLRSPGYEPMPVPAGVVPS